MTYYDNDISILSFYPFFFWQTWAFLFSILVLTLIYFLFIYSPKNKARKEELYFLTHLFQNKESPDGDVVAMSLIISSVSPFAKLVNSRIEILKDALEDLGVKK
jgi:hypothetical protein